MKYIAFLFLLIIQSSYSFSQTKIKYTVSAEAHALMCPFLSPQLMTTLGKNGAEDVYKDEQLQVHFYTSIDRKLSDERILQLVDQIGYDPKLFKITRVEE